MTNYISLLHSDYQDEERGGEGKEMRPEEQPKRDISTDSLIELISSAHKRILRVLFVRTSVGTISGQYISISAPLHHIQGTLKDKQQTLNSCLPCRGVSVAIQSQVNVHSCTAEVFIAAYIPVKEHGPSPL